jgi:fumarate reductase subunit D
MKKRSNAPIFWSLFGAGGMLSALVGPALVFITGISVPLGFLLNKDAMSYPRMLHFAGNWAGKAFVLAVISLFLWHAAHRIFHSLHDLRIRTGLLANTLCYGGAFAGTVAVVLVLATL